LFYEYAPILPHAAGYYSIGDMFWDLHGIVVEGVTNNALLAENWHKSFSSRPAVQAQPELRIHLDVTETVPEAPPGTPRFQLGDLLAYYPDGDIVTAHFPRFGQLRINLETGTTTGRIVRQTLDVYGALEDVIAIGLSPHLRRRGLYLVHAFAASFKERAILLVGDIGAGKTTTGMALLADGWRLLSNDSPLINATAEVLSYPGLLAAYPDTFERFAETTQLASGLPGGEQRRKISVAAESIWPEVWRERAPAGAVVFPQIETTGDHLLEPLSRAETLRRLLPHTVEQWDGVMMPEHLSVLSKIVEVSPGFILRLGPDVSAIPRLLLSTLGW
jgi:hypothetical protein